MGPLESKKEPRGMQRILGELKFDFHIFDFHINKDTITTKRNHYPIKSIINIVDTLDNKIIYENEMFKKVRIINVTIESPSDYFSIKYELENYECITYFNMCDEVILANLMGYLDVSPLGSMYDFIRASGMKVNLDGIFLHLICQLVPEIKEYIAEWKKYYPKHTYYSLYLSFLRGPRYSSEYRSKLKNIFSIINSFFTLSTVVTFRDYMNEYRHKISINDGSIDTLLYFMACKNIYSGFYNEIIKDPILSSRRIKWTMVFHFISHFYNSTYKYICLFDEITDTNYLSSFKNLDWIQRNTLVPNFDRFLENLHKDFNDIYCPSVLIYIVIKLFKNLPIAKLFPFRDIPGV